MSNLLSAVLLVISAYVFALPVTNRVDCYLNIQQACAAIENTYR
jgi:hypothetical protein